MATTDELNQAEIARVTLRRPVTVGEMSKPEAQRIRQAVLNEVIAVVNDTIANRHVKEEDEAYVIRRWAERERDRASMEVLRG